MIIEDSVTITDLMLMSKGHISNYVDFLIEINKSKISDNIANTDIDVSFDTADSFVYNLQLDNKQVVSSIMPPALLNDIDYSAYSDAYSDSYN